MNGTSYNPVSIKNMILRYIADQGIVSRNDIMQEYGFSLPTVLQKIKELKQEGWITESGQAESRGGRKAQLLSVTKDARYSVGANITAHHLELVLIGLDGSLIGSQRKRLTFEPTAAYYGNFSEEVLGFIDGYVQEKENILGVGIALPGFVEEEQKVLKRSFALRVENYSLYNLEAALPYSVIFRNDADAAAFSEKSCRTGTAFYLSLNYSVGGSFSVNGELYRGSNHKSSEIGHVILVPGGEVCYCGKKGCVDSYCSIRVLTDENLGEFFEQVEKGEATRKQRWEQYLKMLAYTIANLRISYDCDIIVGGYLGGYMEPYLQKLRDLEMEQNYFDVDASFIRCGKLHWEASAYGAALSLVDEFFKTIV